MKKKIFFLNLKRPLFLITGPILLALIFSFLFLLWRNRSVTNLLGQFKSQEIILREELISFGQTINRLRNEDQRLKNNQLEEVIKNIEKTYDQAVDVYEDLLSLQAQTKKTTSFNDQFAQSLNLLSERNYASASAVLTGLSRQIEQEKTALAAQFKIPADLPQSNTPPGSGYSRQSVTTSAGSFMTSLVVADLNSTRVIVDTASDSTCFNDCPVLPLSSYVSRSGAFAGINGSYFCPAAYPSCVGKTNSFDTLLMNKNKVYFNSENNVYSNLPAAIFYGNTARFVTRSLEWGRDTGVDAVIANQPLLTFNNQIFFTGGSDPKQGSKGARSFIGSTGNTVYLGVVHNATVAEAALVVHALGIHNALNLDNGGSTALYSGGYRVGPGRDIPNALLLVKK